MTIEPGRASRFSVLKPGTPVCEDSAVPGKSAALVTALFVVTISADAIGTLLNSPDEISSVLLWLAMTAVLLPAYFLLASVLWRNFRLSESVFWAWALVFLGWAPAYQISLATFPWLGTFSQAHLSAAYVVVLVGEVASLLGAAFGRRINARSPGRIVGSATVGGRTRFTALLAIQISVSVLFVTLMGGALFNGRTEFRSALIALGAMPGGGSLYFLATALSVIVPSMALVALKRGQPVPKILMLFGFAVGFVAVNPLIGSRFLTGSFLVASVGALFFGTRLLRYIPVLSVLLLVTVFPSLDLARGDRSGSSQIQVVSASEALHDPDFDSYEMLTRARVVRDMRATELPPTWLSVTAPLFRWVPLLSDQVSGLSSGSVVAIRSGMTFANVSMPLWGEGYLYAGLPGVVMVMGLLGYSIGKVSTSSFSDPSIAALLFIVLRGSLYEVLGYLLVVGAIAWWLSLDRNQPKVTFSEQGAKL